LVPAFSTSAAIAATQGAALAAIVSSVALFLLTLAHRGLRRRHERILDRRRAGWRADLHAAIGGQHGARLPPVPEAYLADFLHLWNHLRESLRGEAGESLARLLVECGLLPRIRALAQGRSLARRLSAITTLGHLRDRESWDGLEALARQPDSVLSLVALRALVRIDPARALGRLLGDGLRRNDWPLAGLGAALQEAGPDVVTPEVVRLLASPPSDGLERLLKIARFAHRTPVAEAMRTCLGRSEDPNVIGAAIDFIEDERDLHWVRKAAGHPAWRVRMAAARAIGRVGSTADLAQLLRLVEDSSWWVRYRTAQAIVRLPGMTPAGVETLRAATSDRFAADILAHALAEVAP
jgi:hypothetical protein